MVSLLEIMPAQYQFCLWADPLEDIKKIHLMDAVDKITAAYGRHVLTLAKSYTKDGWQMKREFLSPCVTTDIEKVPAVR
jgi:DNA polymerase V